MSAAEKPISAALVASTIDDLRKHAPFSAMSDADLAWFVPELSVVYFAPEAEVLSPGTGVPQHFYIIKSGAIAGFAPNDAVSAAPRWRLSAGECFPLGALLGQRAVTSVYRSCADTFCYRLPQARFQELIARSDPFQAFATHRLANLLAVARRAPTDAPPVHRLPLERALQDVVHSDVVACGQQTSVREALSKMRDGKSDSVLVTDASDSPIGIFTLRDLRDRVALAGYDLDAPIASVMTRHPVSLSGTSMAFEAALSMARHGFRHIVVTSGNRAVGIVSENDLFALQRVGLTALSAAIQNARELDALVLCARDIRALIRDLLQQATPSDQLTRIVSALNDLLTQRIVVLACEREAVDPQRFCWLALGSEGRHEQTLATDQDNGIIFASNAEVSTEQLRETFVSLARGINHALAACGFPLCKGNIMASNSQWCLSEQEWRERFSDWLRVPDAQALLNSSIFFDFRAIAGDGAMATRLREWLATSAKESAVFLRLFAENALGNEPPLGLMRDFTTSEHEGFEDTIDLKVNGITLFVDAARILALSAGVGATNTVERLRDAAKVRGLNSHDVEGWVDAFLFLQSIRLAHQENLMSAGTVPNNYIDPEKLNALEQRILKESLRQARKLQERLRMDYRL